METLDLRSARKPVEVWATGDWHKSNIWHDGELFDRHYQEAVRQKRILLHIGDALEMVTPGAKVAQRGALAEQAKGPEDQRKEFIALLEGLKAPGFILGGNHEFRIDAITGLDFIASITDAVGSHMHPLALPGRVRLLVGKQRYEFYLHHGEGPVVSPTSLFDRIQRDEEGLDVILAGHIHASTSDPAEVSTPDGERVILRLRVGHYLKPPRYILIKPVARRGARGSWVLTLHPDKHQIESRWLGPF